MHKLNKREREDLLSYIDTEWALAKSTFHPWIENCGRWQRTYENELPAKTDPWPGCSNLNFPVTAISVERMHSSLISLVRDPKDIITALPTEETDATAAEKVTRFGNFVFGRMKFADKYDPIAHATLIRGQVGCVVFWNDKRRLTRITHRVPLAALQGGNSVEAVATYHYDENLIEVSRDPENPRAARVRYMEAHRS